MRLRLVLYVIYHPAYFNYIIYIYIYSLGCLPVESTPVHSLVLGREFDPGKRDFSQ